jgi:hypothetical protein
MDILFGTYRCPDHEPEHFGIIEPTPTTYLGYLIRPLLPRKSTNETMDPSDRTGLAPVGERLVTRHDTHTVLAPTQLAGVERSSSLSLAARD